MSVTKPLVAALIAGALALFAFGAHEPSALASPAVSVDVFVDTLSPYGEWVEVAEVGRVWRPHARVVGASFVPYGTGGHWELTDHGWVFETDWAWGWAPFHYGRWFLDARWGWVWLPDTTWGPAWVDWRWGGGYVGWVPLAPAHVRVIHESQWVFVEHRHFVERDVFVRRLPAERVHVAFTASARIDERITVGGRSWVRGPDPVHVEAAVHRPIVAGRLVVTEGARPTPHHIEKVEVRAAGLRANEEPRHATPAVEEGAHEKRHPGRARHEGGAPEKERKKHKRH